VKTGQKPLKRSRRALLLILGTLCVALGVLGMFLPLLPTTPFLLLAATCYARSSERFYRWLVTNRWCGEYIRNYREGRGIPLKQKAVTILLLWLTIGSTAWLAVSQWWVRCILLGVAVGVTIHLVKAKTYRPKAKPGPSLGEPGLSERET
jgi:uncharacterized membrane protein YbaN (DUF454 family)